MCLKVQCPDCGASISVVGVSLRRDKDSLQTASARFISRQLRVLTNRDKHCILKHNDNGWRRKTKQGLARRLGVSVAQVAAVCAWTHPNLGGQQYRNLYQ